MFCKSCECEPPDVSLLNEQGVCVLCEPEQICDLCGDSPITKVINGKGYNPESFTPQDDLVFCPDCLSKEL